MSDRMTLGSVFIEACKMSGKANLTLEGVDEYKAMLNTPAGEKNREDVWEMLLTLQMFIARCAGKIEMTEMVLVNHRKKNTKKQQDAIEELTELVKTQKEVIAKLKESERSQVDLANMMIEKLKEQGEVIKRNREEIKLLFLNWVELIHTLKPDLDINICAIDSERDTDDE